MTRNHLKLLIAALATTPMPLSDAGTRDVRCVRRFAAAAFRHFGLDPGRLKVTSTRTRKGVNYEFFLDGRDYAACETYPMQGTPGVRRITDQVEWLVGEALARDNPGLTKTVEELLDSHASSVPWKLFNPSEKKNKNFR